MTINSIFRDSSKDYSGYIEKFFPYLFSTAFKEKGEELIEYLCFYSGGWLTYFSGNFLILDKFNLVSQIEGIVVILSLFYFLVALTRYVIKQEFIEAITKHERPIFFKDSVASKWKPKENLRSSIAYNGLHKNRSHVKFLINAQSSEEKKPVSFYLRKSLFYLSFVGTIILDKTESFSWYFNYSGFLFIELVIGYLYPKNNLNKRNQISKLRTNILRFSLLVRCFSYLYLLSYRDICNYYVSKNFSPVPNTQVKPVEPRVFQPIFFFITLLEVTEEIILKSITVDILKIGSYGYYGLLLKEMVSSIFTLSEMNYDLFALFKRNSIELFLSSKMLQSEEVGDLRAIQNITRGNKDYLNLVLAMFFYSFYLCFKIVNCYLLYCYYSRSVSCMLTSGYKDFCFNSKISNINHQFIFKPLSWVISIFFSMSNISGLARSSDKLLKLAFGSSLGLHIVTKLVFRCVVNYMLKFLVILFLLSYTDVYLEYYYLLTCGEYLPVEIEPVFKEICDLEGRNIYRKGQSNRLGLTEALIPTLLSYSTLILRINLMLLCFINRPADIDIIHTVSSIANSKINQ